MHDEKKTFRKYTVFKKQYDRCVKKMPKLSPFLFSLRNVGGRIEAVFNDNEK